MGGDLGTGWIEEDLHAGALPGFLHVLLSRILLPNLMNVPGEDALTARLPPG
jgi:hypothetical protein